jgi:hypothetical protein
MRDKKRFVDQHRWRSIATSQARRFGDFKFRITDILLKLPKLFSNLDRASQPTTHVSANGNMATWRCRAAEMGKEPYHILNNTNWFTYLVRDAIDVRFLDASMLVLSLSKHLGDACPNLAID